MQQQQMIKLHRQQQAARQAALAQRYAEEGLQQQAQAQAQAQLQVWNSDKIKRSFAASST
jgi:hypothetical protein